MTLLTKFLGSLARIALGGLVIWFVDHGVIPKTDAPAYTEALVNWAVPIGIAAVATIWAWMNTKGRVLAEQLWHRMVVHAAAAPAGTPIRVIEAAAKADVQIGVVSREVDIGTPADRDGPEAA